jgi:transposase-like protein
MSKRRRFTAKFKAEVVLEVLTGVKSNAEACRQYDLKPQVLSSWKSEFLERATGVFERERTGDGEQARIAELERLVGQLTLELEVAKKASRLLAQSRNGR